MATYYVDSNAAGAGTGADWANAFTTLTAAFSGKAAGDVFYVAHNHAESTAGAVTLTSPGTQASPCKIICVNSAGSVPPVSADIRATATVTTTGANALSLGAQIAYFEGIIFSAGSGAVNAAMNVGNANGATLYMKNCAFRKAGTTAWPTAIAFGVLNGSSSIFLDNCSVQNGSASDTNAVRGNFVWRNTATPITGTNYVSWSFSDCRRALIEGVDFSSHTGAMIAAMAGAGDLVFKDCRLGSSFAPVAPIVIGAGTSVIRSDNGDTNYRSERYQYQGTMTTETTTVRTGGASDGTTTIAWKIVPTANNDAQFPFECFPISIWNETTGSAVTLTIEGTWGGGAVPTTADIWMDVEYLGTSGNPRGSITSGGVADVLAAGVNHTASSETWGAGGTTKFKMAVSVTPQEKGPITVYIKYANATNTVWIDPKITVS